MCSSIQSEKTSFLKSPVFNSGDSERSSMSETPDSVSLSLASFFMFLMTVEYLLYVPWIAQQGTYKTGIQPTLHVPYFYI